jgi:hypothetical protein
LLNNRKITTPKNAVGSALCCLLLLFLSSEAVNAQSPQSSPTPSPVIDSESELRNSQKANHDAQAAYYKAQTEQIRQRGTDGSVWRKLLENPGAIGVVGALVAAIVALFTFFMNYRTALQNQKDSQFYEALKRFGDRDSPTVRATAATILSEMAQTHTVKYRFNVATGLRRVKLYYNARTIVDQLVTGLLLEHSPICISTISKALKKLVQFEPAFTLEMVSDANLKLQIDLCNSIAEFWGVHKLKPLQNPHDKTWQELTHWVGFDQAAIRELTARHTSEFSNFLESYLYLYSRLAEEDRKIRTAEIRDRIKVLSTRLQATVDLLQQPLALTSQKITVEKLFLGKAVIDRADYTGSTVSQ